MGLLRWRYDAKNGPILLTGAGSGAPNHTQADANVLSLGTSTYPVYSDSGGKMMEMRAKFDTNASGDMRGAYLRVEAYGDPGSGCSVETLRAFTVVNEAITNAYGAHISLAFSDTDGAVSGEGRAVKATLHIPSGISCTGTLSPLQSVIYSDAADSDPAGATTLAFLECNIGGNATGGADVDDDAVLFSIQGNTIAAGNLVQEDTITADTLIKIKIGGTLYYIPCSATIT